MRVLTTAFGLLISASASASDGRYKLFDCPDTAVYLENCTVSLTGETDEFYNDFIPLSKSNQNRMEKAIAGGTGMAIGIVRSTIHGLRSAALGAGYTRFTATLAGPSGSVTFRMNLTNGAWGMTGSDGNAGRHDGNGKHRIP